MPKVSATQRERDGLILDASVAITIDFLGYVAALATLYTLYIPRQVKTELKDEDAKGKAGYTVPEREEVTVLRCKPSHYRDVRRQLQKGTGETAVLALHLSSGYIVAIDEQTPYRWAMRQGYPAFTSLHLLGEMHQAGLLDKPLGDEIDTLLANGWRLTKKLRDRAVKEYPRGETWI